MLVVTRSGIEVREIPGHVVNGEEHVVRVAKGAKRPLARAVSSGWVSGRTHPYLVVELEVADPLKLLGMLHAIGN